MKYSCEKCFYSTELKFCYENHKKSKAHIKRENNEFEAKYECKICKKSYKSNSGFCSHKKKCEEEKKRKDDEEMRNLVKCIIKDNTEIKNFLIKENAEIKKENKEMKDMLIEISKKDFTKIENNTNNSHNKIDFNIFLNEKCKNAINMSSLIESIVFGMKDIENIEKHGYVKTITDIVVEKISDYSVYERPLHYYIEDKPNDEENEDEEPNEIIHIKENNKWNKEDPSEHDVLLTNMNTINDVLQQKTKNTERINQEVKSGRRYNKTGKIITNILETVKMNEEHVKELL
jgi:hypothetical protein